jgi:hypothetical protein
MRFRESTQHSNEIRPTPELEVWDLYISVGIILCILAASPLIERWSAHFSTRDYQVTDEGIVLYAALRSMSTLPHMGFQYYYTGGLEVGVGVIFSVFEPSVEVARWTVASSMTMMAVFVYLLYRLMGLSRFVGVISSCWSVVLAHLINYHTHPAWFAMMCIPLGMILLLKGIEKKRMLWLLLSGVTVGIMLSVKQNTAVYVFLGFLFFLHFLMTGEVTDTTSRTMTRWTFLLRLRFLAALVLPLVVTGFLIYIIAAALTVINIALLLLAPAAIAIANILALWKHRDTPTSCSAMISLFEKRVLVVSTGVLLGFMPMIVLYAIHGGLGVLFDESFFRIHSVLTKLRVDWGFLSEASLENPIIMLRKIVIHGIPLLAIAIGFYVNADRLRTKKLTGTARVLLLNSILFSVLHFTLFPIAGTIYLPYLFPLAVLSFVYVTERLLFERIALPFWRGALLVGILLTAVASYVGIRIAGGDWDEAGLFSKKTVLLQEARGGMRVPVDVAIDLVPLLEYLKTRPQEESFIACNRYNELLAFLTGRRTMKDLALQFYVSYGYHDEEFSQIQTLARERAIDVIILTRMYLRGSPTETELLDFLEREYTLALRSDEHFIFQRIPSP